MATSPRLCDAVGFAEAVADVVVDGPGFFVALAGERVLGQAQVHVAEARDAVGFAEAVADFVVDGPGFFVALAGERVLGQAQVHVAEAA